MTIPTIDELCELLALEIGRQSVAADQRLIADLGVASVAMIGVLASVEERWDIAVDETDLGEIETLADLHRVIAALAE